MEKRELRALIEEFNDQRAKTSNNGHRQAKELQSLQSAIRAVADKLELTDEDAKEVSNIINITNEWWCED